MSASRSLGFAALALMVGACTRTPNTAVTPKSGPKASVYATYSGGMLNRRADATFRVDEGAYVMVGHLGGDGLIEVLYPLDGRETGRVPGRKWYRTRSFSAYYDAFPSLYSFAMTHYRNVGAQLDSYDGLGHGYVFIIASKSPLRFDRISQFGLWDDFEVTDYNYTADPRASVKAFADLIAGRSDYTLQFARSFGSTALTNYADQLMDCAFLSTMSLASFGQSFFYNFGLMGMTSPYRYLRGCGSSYAWFPRYGTQLAYSPWPIGGTPQTPGPGGAFNFRRPGMRQPGETGPALGLNTPRFNPGTTTSNADLAPRTRGRTFAPRGADFGARNDFGGTRRTSFDDRDRAGSAPRSFGARAGMSPAGMSPVFEGSRSPMFGGPRSTPMHDGGSAGGSTPVQRSQPVSEPSRSQPASNPAPSTSVQAKAEVRKP